MEQEPENIDSPNDEPEVTPEGETAEEKAERLEGLNKQLFERAKKAEGFEQVDGKWVKKPKTVEVKPKPTSKEPDLTTTDVYALMKADVPEEDIDEVKKAAKVLGISVVEALKDSVTKTILERRASLRKTAEATNTVTARPGTKKVSDDEILQEASKGNIPEKGSADAERLFWAKRGGKK